MFDISFTEIFVLSIVVMIVFGPERLPKLARAIGYVINRFNYYTNQLKLLIKDESKSNEFTKIYNDIETIKKDFDKQIYEIKQLTSSITRRKSFKGHTTFQNKVVNNTKK